MRIFPDYHETIYQLVTQGLAETNTQILITNLARMVAIHQTYLQIYINNQKYLDISDL